ncbi:MAG: protein kinase [Gammaproteobacteria bacterium]|nr:protein kinase [Gammaproteobacteria bacterium]
MAASPQELRLPERVGRYEIERLLGRGAQGAVLLARDAELDRSVALKLLKRDPHNEPGTLVSEARIVSRLQHPNIVTLHDVGNYNGCNYLVFEYIEGLSLKALIDNEGALPFARCVILMSQILAGVAYLHEHDIIHRDLSPANILISRDGVPKVTDFGISVLRQSLDPNTDSSAAGTLRYMAPEAFLEQPPSQAVDVFTLASIFYEMLTGRRLFDGDGPGDIINEIMHGPAVDMSARGFDVDARIARIIEQASRRDPATRYPSAREMKNELDAFRLPRQENDPDADVHSTVEFLLRRMSFKRGFSSLSQHVGQLLEIASEDSLAPAERLVNIIAKDVTLSQRVLTMANSAYYGKGEITALGRAIVLLGLDQVRMCIIGVLLENEFEAGSTLLRQAMALSFHSAALAKALAPAFGIRSRPEAFSCAMFHDLGRLLTIHYFGEEHAEILDRAARLHCDELTASRQVLGIAYHELGAAVGLQWKLGPTLVGAMKPLPRGVAEMPATEAERQRLCAGFANAVSRIRYEHDSPDYRDVMLADVAHRVGPVACLDPAEFDAALRESAALTAQYARLLRIPVEDGSGIARLVTTENWAGAA